MKRIFSLFLILFSAGFLCADARPQSSPGEIAIVGAKVIDGTGAPPREANVVIREDRILAVGPGAEFAPTARVIDGKGMTLIPGLFDLHTHLPYASASDGLDDWPKNLKAYLYCGVTSVVDFGSYPETFEPMRRLIRTGVVPAPRISLAARISTPGGHGAEGGRGEFFTLEVSTAREARAAVRRVLPYHPDVIKAFTDGWRYGAAPDLSSMNEETLTALVDEAHKNGLEVLTHTVTLDRAKIAARAGVDALAHGIGDKEVDNELFGLMKAKGTAYVPTLAVFEPRGRDVLTPLLDAVLPPAARRGVNPPLVPPQNPPLQPAAGSAENGDTPRLRRWTILQNNTAALRKAGITFAVGTDSGVTGTHHGWATLRELQLLVAGGLTPMEAITAATGGAARVVKADGERGTIAPGKFADLVLIDGAPDKDIRDIEKVKRVFLGGKEIDREKLAREMAEPGATILPALQARELIDDFESPNGRSSIDTLWVNSTDSGADASRMLYGKIARQDRGHALSASVRMSAKERPYGRLTLPLSRGAVEPVDARAFRALRFDARGDGDYRLLVASYNAPDFQATFAASKQWRTVSVDFSALKRSSPGPPWAGDSLRSLSFEVARMAGEFGWLEIDNLRFYR
jgi:imidazolonepropionase-like amidohydrolase